MRNSIIYILLVFLTTFASVSASYREYIFKMPPSAVKMFSSEPQFHRTSWFMWRYNVTNIINLSYFSKRSMVGLYKDDRMERHHNPKGWYSLGISQTSAYIGYITPSMFDSFDYVASGYPLLLLSLIHI